eukprot:CAMPEP_0198671390 /NCGR_PEP_ID=MMETSP1467-20131203/85953_1 /TAXON_ID=1462469 /ORGANISM="unid. sp., Strain CCMP2135" /LENGTH=37 /DNA_ID= /DNA_START= /DNA_END= /DNA_ORIENTATION=
MTRNVGRVEGEIGGDVEEELARTRERRDLEASGVGDE